MPPELRKELKHKWKQYMADNPRYYRHINQHHYFRARYSSKFWLKEIDNLIIKSKLLK